MIFSKNESFDKPRIHSTVPASSCSIAFSASSYATTVKKAYHEQEQSQPESELITIRPKRFQSKDSVCSQILSSFCNMRPVQSANDIEDFKQLMTKVANAELLIRYHWKDASLQNEALSYILPKMPFEMNKQFCSRRSDKQSVRDLSDYLKVAMVRYYKSLGFTDQELIDATKGYISMDKFCIDCDRVGHCRATCHHNQNYKKSKVVNKSSLQFAQTLPLKASPKMVEVSDDYSVSELSLQELLRRKLVHRQKKIESMLSPNLLHSSKLQSELNEFVMQIEAIPPQFLGLSKSWKQNLDRMKQSYPAISLACLMTKGNNSIY